MEANHIPGILVANLGQKDVNCALLVSVPEDYHGIINSQSDLGVQLPVDLFQARRLVTLEFS